MPADYVFGLQVLVGRRLGRFQHQRWHFSLFRPFGIFLVCLLHLQPGMLPRRGMQTLRRLSWCLLLAYRLSDRQRIAALASTNGFSTLLSYDDAAALTSIIDSLICRGRWTHQRAHWILMVISADVPVCFRTVYDLHPETILCCKLTFCVAFMREGVEVMQWLCCTSAD